MSLAPGRVPALPEGACGTTRPTRTGPVATGSSCPPGHSSLTLYIQLYLSGYGLELDDLKAFRTWGSQTPGHPEHGHTAGVETTTGPLGQGVANAVGMAMAARYERGLFDPDAAPGHLARSTTPSGRIASRRRPGGGHLRRGVLARRPPEARQPGRRCTTTTTSPSRATPRPPFSEDVARSATRRTAGTSSASSRRPNGDLDPQALHAALEAAPGRDRAARRSSRPARSSPGPRPNAQNTERGARLGARRRRGRRHQAGAGLRPGAALRGRRRRSWRTPARSRDRGREAHAAWEKTFDAWRTANPRARRRVRPDRRRASCPTAGRRRCPVFAAGKDVATREASGEVLQALGAVIPELWGGSADLAGLQQHHHRQDARRSCRRATRCRAPTRTAARSTSASASTPWARS